MLSRNVILTSVSLVIGYFYVQFQQGNLVKESEELNEILVNIDEVCLEYRDFEVSRFRHACKRKASYQKYINQVDMDLALFSIMKDLPSLAKTIEGRKLLITYNLDLDIWEKNSSLINSILINKGIQKRVKQLSIDLEYTPHIVKTNKIILKNREEYTLGNEYELDFRFLEIINDNQVQVSYKIDEDWFDVENNPVRFKEKPTNMYIKTQLICPITGNKNFSSIHLRP